MSEEERRKNKLEPLVSRRNVESTLVALLVESSPDPFLQLHDAIETSEDLVELSMILDGLRSMKWEKEAILRQSKDERWRRRVRRGSRRKEGRTT